MKALSIGIALIGILTVAQARDLRSEIDASNKMIAAAMMKKDMATLKKAIVAGTTANFVYTENGQSQKRDQMLEHMSVGLGMMKKITSASVKILTLKEQGNAASGTSQHSMSGIMVGPDKKEHKMVFSGVCSHKYVKEGGKWKMSAMSWISQKATMDGKPATMGG